MIAFIRLVLTSRLLAAAAPPASAQLLPEPSADPAKDVTAPAAPMDWVSNLLPTYPMAPTMQSQVDEIGGRGGAVPDFALAPEVERVLEAARVSSFERRWVKLASLD